MKRRFYPVSLNLKGKSCLVIGDDLADKVQRLSEAGARVETAPLAGFDPVRITDQFFVLLSFKASPGLAEAVEHRCRAQRVLLAAVDRPEMADVIHPALYDRGRLNVAITTEGAAPGLARKIREGLEQSLADQPIDAFLDDLAALRERLDKAGTEPAARRAALLQAIEGFSFTASLQFPAGWKSGGSRR
jgi:precorrin-2 dehydrogenase/sirohydrochlorin ferrochelatase